VYRLNHPDLAQHPVVEARLLDETRNVLRGRTPTASDLPNLPSSDMVVREAMRLYPPAPGIRMRLTKR